MAQVDRHLTKVNTVDLLIRVNNYGWKPGASHRAFGKAIVFLSLLLVSSHILVLVCEYEALLS
jgi:hypothetical protein